MDSTLAVGRRLVELCKQGKNLEAVNTLYAPDIVSTEVFGDDTMPKTMRGIDAVRGKNQWWFDNHEIHSGSVSGPYPNGDRFITHMAYDVTVKAGPHAGKRMKFEEAGLYTVKDGKIVQEEFFYDMTGEK
jgi:ketosteroid isomerase-like protein